MTSLIRDEVRKLAAWGPVPPDESWDDRASDLEEFTHDAQRVQKPITEEERAALLVLLDVAHDDSLYGLLDLVVSILESSPDTGWQLSLPVDGRPWYNYLSARYRNTLG